MAGPKQDRIVHVEYASVLVNKHTDTARLDERELKYENPDADYETCTTLIDDRYLDSLSMVSLVAELEDTFDITIPAVEVTANNFNSVDAITKLVERLVEEDED